MTDVDRKGKRLAVAVVDADARAQWQQLVQQMENQILHLLQYPESIGSDSKAAELQRAQVQQFVHRANQLKALCGHLEHDVDQLQALLKRTALLVIKLLKKKTDVREDLLAPLLQLQLALLRKIQSPPSFPGADASKSARDWKRQLALVVFSCALCFVMHLESEQVALNQAICNEIVRLSRQKSQQELIVWCLEDQVALCSQQFTNSEWLERQSSGKLVLQWTVSQAAFPYLGGDLLGRLLALVFPLVEDLQSDTQLVGAKTLCHIIKNVTSTELRWYEDVLVDVFRIGLTSNNPATLDAMLECLGVALEMLSPPGELKHYDAFFLNLVNKTSICSEMALKSVFIRRLRPLIRQMGVPNTMHIVRYLQPLVRVLCETIENCLNGELIVESLETLRILIQSAWIRAALHQERILVAVVRAVMACELLDVTTTASQTQTQAMAQSIDAKCSEICAILHQTSLHANEIDAFFMKIRANSPPQQIHLTAFCNKLLETDRLGRYDRHSSS